MRPKSTQNEAPVVSRWGARLSAILIRGNAAVVRACIGERPTAPHVDGPGAAALSHLLPEGDCAYELGVESGWVELADRAELLEG